LYVDCEEDLEAKMKEFLFECQDEPVLFHVKIERTPCLPLVAPGQRLENMILEDEDFEVDPAAAPS
jgi:acetolactate synthase I/II/III large subunit